MTEFNGLLYFAASKEESGRELWQSDGTESGTVLSKSPVLRVYDNPLAYSSNGSTLAIASTATLADADTQTFNGGTLNVTFRTRLRTGDRLSTFDRRKLAFTTTHVRFNGGVVGRISRTSQGLQFVFNKSARTSIVQSILRSVSFESDRVNSDVRHRSPVFALTDGVGAASRLQVVRVVPNYSTS